MKDLRLALVIVVAGALWGQAEKPGRISGVVIDAATGHGMAGLEVAIDRGAPGANRVVTESDGRFSFSDVPPGQRRITAYGARSASGPPAYLAKLVQVADGQSVENLRFRLLGHAELSGKVVDQNKEPLAGVRVTLVAREYSLGALRYVYTGMAVTDDEGTYSMGVRPGRAYLLMAQKRPARLQAIADTPAEIKLRKPAYATTYYPGVTDLDAATPLTLASGETRSGVDLRVLRTDSYCVEGVAQGAGSGVRLSITDKQPTSGAVGDGAMFISTPSARVGADGRFRFCGLHPGSYVLTVIGESAPFMASTYGTSEVNIVDRDVRGVSVATRPQVAIQGEVVWHGEPPDPPMKQELTIGRQPMARSSYQGEADSAAKVGLPGKFEWPNVWVDSYRLRVNGVPKEVYIKEMTYAGQNLLLEPLRAGTGGAGENTLRIVLARDGGTISARVADKDGNAIGDARVLVLPVSVSSEAALATLIVSGQCDQSGSWTSSALAPGKYYVTALDEAHDNSPESIGRLWASRLTFREVELGTGANVQVTLAPMDLR